MSAASFVIDAQDGSHTIHLLVDGMHCPSCIAAIESAVKKDASVLGARVNLSTKRMVITWKGAAKLADGFVAIISRMGYRAVPFDPETSDTEEKRQERFLLKCLAVAGFASGNLMLFSIPLWTSDSIEMGEATRTFFHWLQAIIAIPAIAYAGRPFFYSALRALKTWHTNMDVPISVAVLLATGMSLFETATFGQHSYFDSAVMLLFFLLIGRYLEARAKGRARGAAHDLLQMMVGTATVIHEDGTQEQISFSELSQGMRMLIAVGEKIGADGEIVEGNTEIDTSLITGESLPRAAVKGETVFAGTINVASPVLVRVNKPAEHSLIADIVKLMETAEQSQARYVTLADRISGWYTPAVHALALVTFIGWFWWGQVDWEVALLTAASVLIITCPCALGLAVPVVQVLASSTLMRAGILLKSGSALERLASITHAVFDKTGTLTVGHPELLNPQQYHERELQLAASLAAHSKHPLSQAMARTRTGALLTLDVTEKPGAGLEAIHDGMTVKLGKRSWCTDIPDDAEPQPELWLAAEGKSPIRFTFADPLRADTAHVIAVLRARGIRTSLLSGDRPTIVQHVADSVGITESEAALTPVEKSERIQTLKRDGATVLMVGDGLNDAPSLAAADVSMSPTSAIDITQNAADIVFQGAALSPVLNAWRVARFSQALVRQNFALALIYNIIAVPLAVMGYATPLIAAIAMSGSSLLVIANAMRLNLLHMQDGFKPPHQPLKPS